MGIRDFIVVMMVMGIASVCMAQEGPIYINGDSVGIGTTRPPAKFSVLNGGIWICDDYALRSGNTGSSLASRSSSGVISYGSGYPSDTLVFNSGGTGRIWVNTQGNIGVGIVNASQKIEVAGNVSANAFYGDGSRLSIVTSSRLGWSDYVFDPEYRLSSLREVDTYIKKNRHLPGVPSEKEVMTKGVTIGAMQAALLRKIEELTLYSIAQEKKIEALEARLKVIEGKVK